MSPEEQDSLSRQQRLDQAEAARLNLGRLEHEVETHVAGVRASTARRRRWGIVVSCVAAGLAGLLVGQGRVGPRTDRTAVVPPRTNLESVLANTPDATAAAAPSRSRGEPDPAGSRLPRESHRAASRPPEESDPAASGSSGERAALRGSLDVWLAATNARDFATQMKFYPARLDAYYLARNVPRAAVLAEKARVFGTAHTIDVRAGDPEIVVAPDHRSARMRFRKQYVIAGDRVNRRGEVLQELRWVKTDPGWRIVSERDVRVLH